MVPHLYFVAHHDTQNEAGMSTRTSWAFRLVLGSSLDFPWDQSIDHQNLVIQSPFWAVEHG